MTENQSVNQATEQVNKPSDKEFNFRAIEAKLREERAAREAAERKAEEALRIAQEAQKYRNQQYDDEDESEPYIDHKKLERKLSSFEKKLEEKIDKKAEEKAMYLLQKKEEEEWINRNSDFADVLNEDNLTRLVNKAPAMAESIRRMPDGLEKQKLVYNAIKTMGLDKPESKQPSVQEKIDSNRRSPYYQPSGVANAPYAMQGDFSPSGQKNAYDKLQELKKRMTG